MASGHGAAARAGATDATGRRKRPRVQCVNLCRLSGVAGLGELEQSGVAGLGELEQSGVAGLGELHRRGLEALHRPEHDDLLARLGVVLDVDEDDLAGAELLEQQPLGERVLDQALDGPAQRPGAQLRVVALVGEEVLGLLGELEAQALALELALTRSIIRSTIWVTSSLVSSWKTMVSSMRFRNSGRKCCLSASLTFSFIFS